MGITARQAVVSDAEELTRLREVMISTFGPIPDHSWREPCIAAFRTALADPAGPLAPRLILYSDRGKLLIQSDAAAPGAVATLSQVLEPGTYFLAVTAVPTLVLLKGPKELARLEGALPKPELVRWVEGALG